jgi:hypothetical protein
MQKVNLNLFKDVVLFCVDHIGKIAQFCFAEGEDWTAMREVGVEEEPLTA